jgi:excinuclease UvrABC ATPase subunit
VFVSSSYTPDSYDNITLVLNGGYTPDTYDNITLILGEETELNPSTSFYIWDGSDWVDYSTNTIKFRCRPTQTNCEPVNQSVGSSQSIYKVCNSGEGYGNSIVMNMNATIPNIDLKCDDDYTSADATILTTSNQTISSSIYPDSCVYISCWADYSNPTSGGLFQVNAYVI